MPCLLELEKKFTEDPRTDAMLHTVGTMKVQKTDPTSNGAAVFGEAEDPAVKSLYVI